MAEAPEKKDDKKEGDSEVFFDIEMIALVLVIGIALVARVMYLWSTGSISNALVNNAGFVNGTELVLISLVTSFITFSNIISAILFIMFVYTVWKMNETAKAWRLKLYPMEATGGAAPQKEIEKTRWQTISAHTSTDNPNDWRQAILEADIMLSELLDSIGYPGDTIGDKLKVAAKTPFKTLNAAWDAHKVRNAIAHQGQDFAMTAYEARRVVSLYESVFREFDWI